MPPGRRCTISGWLLYLHLPPQAQSRPRTAKVIAMAYPHQFLWPQTLWSPQLAPPQQARCYRLLPPHQLLVAKLVGTAVHARLITRLSITKSIPLIISPAFPPIPGKVVEKARSGSFIEIKEFLGDKVTLLQKLKELGHVGAVSPATQSLVAGSRLREVTDPLTCWVSCFLAFMASWTSHEETRDMAAYAMIIIMLSRKHSGSGGLLYDRQFRQHLAAGSTLPWADINASLMAATVLSHAGDRPCHSCSLCLGADHTKEECDLASLELNKSSPASPGR